MNTDSVSIALFGLQNPIISLILVFIASVTIGILVNLAAHRALVDRSFVSLKSSFLLILLIHVVIVGGGSLFSLIGFDFVSLLGFFIPFVIGVFTKLKLDDAFPWWKALILYPINVIIYYILIGIFIGLVLGF